jgi:mRNA interferase RelE/StbE
VLHDSKRVVSEERAFRIRIGDYRALYEVDWNNKIILIDKMDKRSRAYD